MAEDQRGGFEQPEPSEQPGGAHQPEQPAAGQPPGQPSSQPPQAPEQPPASGHAQPAGPTGPPDQAAAVAQLFTPPPPPPRRGVSVVWLVLAIFFFIGMVLSWIAVAVVASGGGEIVSAKPAVAMIKITGLIQSEGGPPPFGGGGTIGVLDELRKAEKDEAVKAVVVWIDSPGGSPAASEAVYSKIMELKQKKPVVVAMGDVAASGGYYIASAATKIVACPSTETGSIGVIFSGFNVAELMKRFGIKPQTITTGPYKDTGSPFREMRPDERKLIEGLLKDIYEQFVAAVARGRKMPVEKVRELADGRVYTGRQAKALGLVDELGSRDDAIRLAAELGGIEGWPRIKRYEKAPGLLPLLMGSEALAPRRPWYVALFERPGPWLTLPVPGAGFIMYAAR